MLVIEKLKEVPLGAVLLKHLSSTTCWPNVEQLRPEFKNVPDDRNVQTWLDEVMIGGNDEFAA